MKKTWILLLILCGFAMAQRPYNNQRSGYAQNILWRDLHPSTQDSLRKVIGDSVAALSVDGFSLFVNADNQIAQKVYADTAALKAASGDSLGSLVNLRQLSSSNTNGSGIFAYVDSTNPEGSIAYGSSVAGKQWIFVDYLKNKKLSAKQLGISVNDSTLASDNRTRLQKAINDISSSGGGAIEFTFDIDDTVFVDSTINLKNATHLIGSGGWIKMANGNANKHLFRFTSTAKGNFDSIILDGLKIDGNAKNNTPSNPANYYLIRTDSVDFVTIENLTLQDAQYTVHVFHSTKAVIRNCYAKNVYTGLFVEYADVGRVENNDIDNSTYNNPFNRNAGGTVAARSCLYSYVNNNSVTMSNIVKETTQQAAVIMGAFSGYPIEYGEVIGNKVNCRGGTYNFGITIYAQADVNDIIVMSNQIDSVETIAGIEINSRRAIVSNNEVTNITTSAVPGIAFNDTLSEGIINGNIIKNTNYGISFSKPVDNSVISNNVLKNVAANGLYFNNHMTNIVLSNNSIKGTPTGMRLYSNGNSENITLTGNTLDSSRVSFSGGGSFQNLTINAIRIDNRGAAAASSMPVGRKYMMGVNGDLFVGADYPFYIGNDYDSTPDSTLVIDYTGKMTIYKQLKIGANGANIDSLKSDADSVYINIGSKYAAIPIKTGNK